IPNSSIKKSNSRESPTISFKNAKDVRIGFKSEHLSVGVPLFPPSHGYTDVCSTVYDVRMAISKCKIENSFFKVKVIQINECSDIGYMEWPTENFRNGRLPRRQSC